MTLAIFSRRRFDDSIKLRLRSRVQHLLVGMLVLTASGIGTESSAQRRNTDRQPPDGFSFSDPRALLERIFGPETDEDRERLERVEITLREEQEFGGQAVKTYLSDLRRRQIRVLRRGEDVAYLMQLVERVRPQMRHAARYRQITVYVADAPDTDARSFPGGTLIFYRGMLEFAESEAALIGVVGHELSHLDHGHQLHGLRRMKLAQETFRSGNFSPERFFSTGGSLMQMIMRPFRPEDELEADRDGATWAYRLGYDPREMAALFRRLHERSAGPGAALPDFLRSHPYHLDRYDAVISLYKELTESEPRKDLFIGRENLVRRTPWGGR